MEKQKPERKESKKLIRRAYDATKKTLGHTLLGVGLAMGIGFAAAGCGGRSGLCPPESPICFPRQDAGAGADVLVKVDSQPKQDAGHDARQNDAGQSDAQKPDSGVPPQYSYTAKTLIGDYLNRELGDRNNGLQTYPMGTSETSPDANPFTDGAGGNIGLAEVSLHRIDGNMFPPLATRTLTDADAAKIYYEEQNVWLRGDSHFSDAVNGVVGKLNNAAYALKFKGANDDLGIPVCTTPTNGTDYSACDYDYKTEVHRLRVNFLGDDWVVSEMVPPSGVAVPNGTQLAPGGYVKLAKEAVSGILNAGESLTVDNLQFRYDNFDATNPNSVSAILSILDSNGNILKKDKVTEGATKEFVVNGKSYRFHVYKIAPGYTVGANWIDCAVFSQELKLQSGAKLDPDYDNNKYWTVYLDWKNKGGSATDTQPDHLRTIVIYSDNIGKLSSGGNGELKAGDYIPIVQDPAAMQFQYYGLTNGNQGGLRFELERNSNYPISATYGPMGANGQRVNCTINAPYVRVVSGAPGQAFTADGVKGVTPAGTSTASNSEFYVAASGASCGGTIGQLGKGSLFMKASPASDYWSYRVHSATDTKAWVNYPPVGDGSSSWAGGGMLLYSTEGLAGNPNPNVDFTFGVSEKAGAGLSQGSSCKSMFALKLAGPASTFNLDVYTNGGTWQAFKKDNIRYEYAGPVSTGLTFMKQGATTERGSQFTQMTDTLVEFKMAGTLVYSQFVLVKK